MAAETGWSIEYITDELGRSQVIAIHNNMLIQSIERERAVSMARIADVRVAVNGKSHAVQSRINRLSEPISPKKVGVNARMLQSMGLKNQKSTPISESVDWERIE